MPPSNHAFLSASAAHRWMNCPPSAKLSSQFPDVPSKYAAEGSDAHELCEFKLRTTLGMDAEDPSARLERLTQEMVDCADGYAEYIAAQVAEVKQHCPDPLLLIEQRVELSRWIPESFGTADAIIIADNTLRIFDFKFGTGVRVNADGNPQMRAYALGAYAMFGALFDFTHISMTVYQPRLSHISNEALTIEDLLHWAKDTLKPAAKLAFTGEGKFRAGDWCRFCKAKAICRARAEANMLLAQFDFTPPATLEDVEIETILAKLDGLTDWASSVKDYALQQALSGKNWNGWKLVEGRANRKYADETAVAAAVSAAGFDPYEKTLLGITAMQRLIGKKRFEELLSDLLVKPQGKPTLVPDTDKRQPINSAKADFKE